MNGSRGKRSAARPGRRIAIIGGGPGGLFLSYLLSRNGIGGLTLYQSAPRLGGKIVTAREHGLTFEDGVAELYDIEGDPLRLFLEQELGLRTFDMHGRSTLVEGQLLSTPEEIERHFGSKGFQILVGFLAEAQKLRPREAFCRSPSLDDNDHPLAGQPFQNVLDKIDDPRIRRFVQISTNCDLAVDPHLTNGLFGLDNLLLDAPMMEGKYCQIYSVVGGIQRIVDCIAPRISAEVRLEDRALAIEKDGDGFRVHSSRSSRRFDTVVVALPIDRLARLNMEGRLADQMARHIEHYGLLGHYLRCTLFFEAAFWRRRVGGHFFQVDDFGGSTVYDEGKRFDSGSRGVLSLLTAGSEAVALDALEDGQIIERALESARQVAAPSPLLGASVSRWIGTVNGQPGGIPILEERSRHYVDETNEPELLVVGDYLYDSTVNGVFSSARMVARILGA